MLRRRLLAATLLPLLAAAATRPVAAQTIPTDDPVLRQIWSLGMDSSRTEQLAQVLLDSVGPRLTGTPEHARASDWLVRTYASWGVPARNERVGTRRAGAGGPRARHARARGPGGAGRRVPTEWPECTKAPRTTNPGLR